jgi:hypothetical protein
LLDEEPQPPFAPADPPPDEDPQPSSPITSSSLCLSFLDLPLPANPKLSVNAE